MITAAEARNIANTYTEAYMLDLEKTIKLVAEQGAGYVVLEYHDRINGKQLADIPAELLETLAEQLRDNDFQVTVDSFPCAMKIKW